MMVYTYKVMSFGEGIGPKHIEKKLGEAAADGYRLVATLQNTVGSVFVMEKLLIPSTSCEVDFAVFDGCRHYVRSGHVGFGPRPSRCPPATSLTAPTVVERLTDVDCEDEGPSW